MTTLAIDLGGTKTLLGLVQGGTCGETIRLPTRTEAGPDAWLDAVAEAAAPWRGQYRGAAIAVSGLVAGEKWWALNQAVLPVPPGFPLVADLRRRLGVPVVALNDAQAAAWGEYRLGAGQGCDMVFVTVSTGVGAGIVLGGRLLTGHRGLAGHLGQFRAEAVGAPWLEDLASGSAIARAGGGDAALAHAAARLAAAFASLHALLDPDCIVVGGGVGLSPGFLPRLRAELAGLPDLLRPQLRPAALGAEAGLLGVADFGAHRWTRMGEDQ